MRTSNRGYVLPQNYEPNDFVCVKVFIPSDPLYLREFWGAYSYFTQWSAWKRDPFHKGKAAARVWADGYALAREEYILRGGCPVTIENIRQNPLNPCALEFSEDGVTWTQFADLSKCAAPGGGGQILRLSNGAIQYYDPCAMVWVDSSPAPTLPDITPAPQYVGVDHGDCLAATNSAAYMVDIINRFLDAMILEGTFASGLLAVIGFLNLVSAIASWLEPLTAIFEGLSLFATDTWDDIRAVDMTDEYKCLMLYSFDADGNMSAANFDVLVAAVTNARNAFESTTVEYSKWDLNLILLKAFGAAGVVKASKASGITEADCDDCGWRAVFDFKESKGGFYPAVWDSPLYKGAWELHTGWKTISNASLDPLNGDRLAIVSRGFQSTTIKSLRIEADVTVSSANLNHNFRVYNDSADLIGAIDVSTGADQVFTWEGTALSTGFGWEALLSHPWPDGDPGGDFVVKKLVLTGTGDNPFT